MEIKKQGHMDEAKPVPGIFEKGFLNQYHNYTGRYAQLIRKTKGYQSLMFGSPLVFDYAFEEHSQKKGYFLANIMAELYQTNIAHQEPFHFHLTGVFNNGYLEKGMKNQTNFLDVHKRDICDIFPPEKLVYLAPHSETPLNLQAEDILVLGATTFFHTERILTQIPWELKRAEELGIRTAFLPVNSFIRYMYVSVSFIVGAIWTATCNFAWDYSKYYIVWNRACQYFKMYESTNIQAKK